MCATNNCLVQISDCHIGTPKNNANLAAVVEKIVSLAQGNIWHVVISGDLTNNGTLSEYLQLQSILSPLKSFYMHVIAGNHDNIANMQKVFRREALNNFSLGQYNIQLVQSQVEHQVFGNIDIDSIDNSLERSILMTHHPVINMESSWDDEISINNKDEFKEFINYSKNIDMICFGHAHEEKSFNVCGIDIYACPSSSYQFNGKKGRGFNIYELGDSIKKTTIWL